ncbi:hypothetical protein [Paraflavitalea sp. CAU 1676]|uniref:hypothetical protein n=1 Tax=Paraflavitalea sp. CAU 1676 TaxID=3032598 RepID=UPI0023DA2AFB|nr:hypothetical protein [Paraflavitalea sp. CAU 1676]MDF2192483.1 hypothetical protein [Paraflavitalea sp. CAU 1676]
MTKKAYTPPIWWLSIILAFEILSTVALFLSLQSIWKSASGELGDYYQRIVVSQLMTVAGMLLLMAGELFVYCRYRYHIRKKQLALIHVVGIFIALVFIPILYSVSMPFVDVNVDVKSTLNTIKQIVAWSILLIAHALFVTVWIDAHKNWKMAARPTTNENADILNDYAEQ